MPFEPLDVYFMWSKDERMLNILWEKVPGEWFLSKYVDYKGESLKDIALPSVAENFDIEETQTFNLPQSLAREIMSRKTP